MIEVSLTEPGAPLPEPTGKDALRFHSSTLRAFSKRLGSLAQQENRNLFVAKEGDSVVAVGLTKKHQVLWRRGDEVRLSDSHARHRVNPRVERVLPLAVGGWYDMAIDPRSSGILEATPTSAPEEEAQRKADKFTIIPSTTLPELSQEAAEAFFASVRRQPHIPFQYTENGCMARAHEMCRLIERHFDLNPGKVVGKIWNFGDLIVKTDNHPDCQVDWLYHVAPVVNLGKERLLVIDPALFEKPVCVAEWRARQTDLSKPFLFTSQEAYDSVESVEGDLFVSEGPDQAAQTLQLCWAALIAQVYTEGPLPYRCGQLEPTIFT